MPSGSTPDCSWPWWYCRAPIGNMGAGYQTTASYSGLMTFCMSGCPHMDCSEGRSWGPWTRIQTCNSSICWTCRAKYPSLLFLSQRRRYLVSWAQRHDSKQSLQCSEWATQRWQDLLWGTGCHRKQSLTSNARCFHLVHLYRQRRLSLH